jgi:hypothetical protein
VGTDKRRQEAPPSQEEDMAFAYVYEFDVGDDRSTINYDAFKEALDAQRTNPPDWEYSYELYDVSGR